MQEDVKANVTNTSYITSEITSKDGTKIGYHQFGRGPGLVLIQGTMGTAHHFSQLAELLASDFTVYTPDRRGRGMSGPTGDNYSIVKEVEDIEAILNVTNAHYVFGLSSGAIIALESALQFPQIEKLAVYEPPFFTKEDLPHDLIEQYETGMKEGNIKAALIAGMKAGQFAPAFMLKLPNRFLEAMVGMAIKQEKRKGTGEYPSMEQLAYTLQNDFGIVEVTVGNTDKFSAITVKDVLILGGSNSQNYLKSANDTLAKLLPKATRIELPKVGHAASWNKDQRGNPGVVAKALRQFFKNTPIND